MERKSKKRVGRAESRTERRNDRMGSEQNTLHRHPDPSEFLAGAPPVALDAISPEDDKWRVEEDEELLRRKDTLTRLPTVTSDFTKTPSGHDFEDLEIKALIKERQACLDLEKPPPNDRFSMVFLILLVHGIGTLMPWNMFITAESYFVNHKFSGRCSEYSKNFLSYLGICAQVPNFVLSLVNLFIQLRGSLTKRIVACLSIASAIFVITIALAMIDSSDWPGTFFVVTMICVVILNGANGIYQNCVYGLAAELPMHYSNAVVLGSNISGTLVSVLNILAIIISPDVKIAAIYYFISALFILLLCFDTYFALPFLKFYRHYHEIAVAHRERDHLEAKRNQMRANKMPTCATTFTQKIRPYVQVFKQGWIQMLNVFFVFFVTLTIFPAMMAGVEPSSRSFPHHNAYIGDRFWTPVTCFLFFNMFAMLGNIVAHFTQFPGPRFVCIPVLLRGLMIPYFMLCNYRPALRSFPVYITEDWAYVVMAILMAFTSGYLSSLCMMFAPRVVDSEKARVAGMMAAFFLILGIVSGVNFTLFVVHVNENWGPLAPLASGFNDTCAQM